MHDPDDDAGTSDGLDGGCAHDVAPLMMVMAVVVVLDTVTRTRDGDRLIMMVLD